MAYLTVSTNEIKIGGRITVTINQCSPGNYIIKAKNSSMEYTFLNFEALEYRNKIEAYYDANNAGNLQILLYFNGSLIDSCYVLVTGTTSSNPEISSINTTPVGEDYKTVYNYYVQGKTRVRFNVGWNAGSGNIDSYELNIDNSTYYGTFSSDNIIYSGIIKTSGSVKYTVTIYDIYGMKSSTSGYIYVYPYSNPSFKYLKIYKSLPSGVADINGDYITCEYEIAYASVNNTNKVKLDLLYNNSVIYTINNEVTGKFTIINSYAQNDKLNLYARVTDTYGGTALSNTQSLSSAGAILNISKHGYSMGIGGLAPSDDNKLECYWDANFSGNLTWNGWPIPEIQKGSFQIQSNTYSIGFQNFKKEFSGAPIILFDLRAPDSGIGMSDSVLINTSSVTKNGFTYSFTNQSSITYTVNWIAIYVP